MLWEGESSSAIMISHLSSPRLITHPAPIPSFSSQTLCSSEVRLPSLPLISRSTNRTRDLREPSRRARGPAHSVPHLHPKGKDGGSRGLVQPPRPDDGEACSRGNIHQPAVVVQVLGSPPYCSCSPADVHARRKVGPVRLWEAAGDGFFAS